MKNERNKVLIHLILYYFSALFNKKNEKAKCPEKFFFVSKNL
jgi:hypothetical protein